MHDNSEGMQIILRLESNGWIKVKFQIISLIINKLVRMEKNVAKSDEANKKIYFNDCRLLKLSEANRTYKTFYKT
jgi:hypothetical protein